MQGVYLILTLEFAFFFFNLDSFVNLRLNVLNRVYVKL